MKNLFFFFLLSFLAACSGGANQTQELASNQDNETDTLKTTGLATPAEDTSPVAEQTNREAAMPPPAQNEFTSGKLTFQVENGENQRGTSTVKVNGTDPVFSKEFPVGGRIEESFLLDLNNDGFSEFYFTVETPEGKIALKGIASYRDRSAGEIYVKTADAKKQQESIRFFTEEGKLFQTYNTPEGKPVRLRYELKKGETSFVLSVVE